MLQVRELVGLPKARLASPLHLTGSQVRIPPRILPVPVPLNSLPPMDGSSPTLPPHLSPQSRRAGRGLRCPGCEGEDAITSLIDSDRESPTLQVDRYQDHRPMFVGFGMGEQDTVRSRSVEWLSDSAALNLFGSFATFARCSPALFLFSPPVFKFVVARSRGVSLGWCIFKTPFTRAICAGRYRGLDDLRVILQEGSTTIKDTGPSTPTRDSNPSSSSVFDEEEECSASADHKCLSRTEIALSPVGWYGHRPTSQLCGGPGSHFRHLRRLGPRENVAGCGGMTGRDPPSAASGMSGLPSGAGALAVRLARAVEFIVEVCPSSCRVCGRRLLRLILHPVSGPIASWHTSFSVGFVCVLPPIPGRPPTPTRSLALLSFPSGAVSSAIPPLCSFPPEIAVC
ncbi:hypothetical protein V8D89_010572 [Ganoderma adspersum]